MDTEESALTPFPKIAARAPASAPVEYLASYVPVKPLPQPASWRTIRITRVQGTVVVTLEGVLAKSAKSGLELLLGDLIEGQGNQSVTIDLARVDSIDLSVLEFLMAVSERALAHGGCLRLYDPSAVADASVASQTVA